MSFIYLYLIFSLVTAGGLYVTPSITINLLSSHIDQDVSKKYKGVGILLASLLFPYTLWKLYEIGHFKTLVLPIIIVSVLANGIKSISFSPIIDKYTEVIESYNKDVKKINEPVSKPVEEQTDQNERVD